MNLYRINLNLLSALDILLKEKSVSRAAKKVFLSQAAMSNNLKKLREIFKDPLLIREKNKFSLTSCAKELQPKLRNVLEELTRLIEHKKSFDPAMCDKTFKIGMSDLWASLILPELLLILKNESPNLKINIIPLTQMYGAESFEKEEYDIGIARSVSLPAFVRKQLAFKDSAICVFNPNHPLAKKEKITISDYAACKHIVYRTDNPNFLSPINQYLESHGEKPRNAVLYLAYIDSLFRCIEKSDYLIGSTFKSAKLLLVGKYNCITKPIPLKLSGIETHIAWHMRFDHDLAHQWLRNKIIGIIKSIVERA